MDLSLMASSLPKLLSAAVITLKLLSASLIIGLFIGLLFAILRLSKNSIINRFAYAYSYVFRGTPLLVQIFIIYYGLGQIEYFRTTFLWVIFKEPYWCAIIAFSLNTGAYTSASGLSTLATYLTDAMAATTTDIEAYFDVVELVQTQASATASYADAVHADAYTSAEENAIAYSKTTAASGATVRQTVSYVWPSELSVLYGYKALVSTEGVTLTVHQGAVGSSASFVYIPIQLLDLVKG